MARRRRYLVLPGRGTLLVSTDLHGNAEDLEALRARFLELRATGGEVHWVLLGDLVHGPDERARAAQPELYDFPDRSYAIVEAVSSLVAEDAASVHLVLGNHDHAHIGGPPVAKFYADEAAHLEESLSTGQRELLRRLFEGALLLAMAPCGVVLAHGSPDDSLDSLRQLEDLSFDPAENDPRRNELLTSFLRSYGQAEAVTGRLLERLSAESGLDLGLVIHGHDRDSEGFFTEGRNQLCPVLFGALRETKRYVELDLAARYSSVGDVRDGVELRRLYPS